MSVGGFLAVTCVFPFPQRKSWRESVLVYDAMNLDTDTRRVHSIIKLPGHSSRKPLKTENGAELERKEEVHTKPGETSMHEGKWDREEGQYARQKQVM